MKFSIPANDFSIFPQFTFPSLGQKTKSTLPTYMSMNQAASFKGICDEDVTTGANLTQACQLQRDRKWAAWVGAWVGECGEQQSEETDIELLSLFAHILPSGTWPVWIRPTTQYYLWFNFSELKLIFQL